MLNFSDPMRTGVSTLVQPLVHPQTPGTQLCQSLIERKAFATCSVKLCAAVFMLIIASLHLQL